MEIKNEPTIAIIACCKMEELYIKEWLDWHLNIVGIDHIFLCDNNDFGYHTQLTDVVKDYIDKGVVTVFNYQGVFPIQPECYNNVYQDFGYNYDWFAVIDIDEFMHLPMFDNKIKKLLLNDNINSYITFSVFCQMHGDNNLINYENLPCQERFKDEVSIKKINDLDRKYRAWGYLTKSIFKGLGHIQKIFNTDITIQIDNQHDVFSNSSLIKRLDVFGNEIPKRYPCRPYFFPGDLYECDVEEYLNKSYNVFHLKHYYTKSLEEYIKYKIFRGDTYKEQNDHEYPYKLNNYFIFNECTEEKINYIKINYPNLLNGADLRYVHL